jgi:histidinol phosphatase-like PHP family hydrolase
MSFKWQATPERVEQAWAEPGRHRMAAYRRFAEKIRSPYVKIGLEVDLFDNGKLLLAPEDAQEDWDILIGAVHFIQDFVPGKTTQQEAEELFIRDVARLVDHPINVLAHPFRFFPRNRLEVPRHLFPGVAGLLADSGVAAEVNFHTNAPDPEVIRQCHEKDVKIALASDTHHLTEAGEFWPHVDVLRKSGHHAQDVPRSALLVPEARGLSERFRFSGSRVQQFKVDAAWQLTVPPSNL